MRCWFYVRCVCRDGRVLLSAPFGDAEEADRWAKLAQQDGTLTEVRIIARPEKPAVKHGRRGRAILPLPRRHRAD